MTKKILSSLMIGLVLCGAAWAACEEEADVVERAQKKVTAAQEALNARPEDGKAQEEKLDAWNAWQTAKEKLGACLQKDRDSSWRSVPGMGGDTR